MPLARYGVYRGGAAVIEPTSGEVIAGPLYDAEGMLLADCDLRRGLHAKRWFDAVGHYSRAEVLAVDAPPGRPAEIVAPAAPLPAEP
jgi:nitrilase